MSKYDSLFDGMNLVDATPVAIDGYLYYGYVRSNGEWAIRRVKSDESEYRIAVGGSGYTTAWTNKVSQNYGYGLIG